MVKEAVIVSLLVHGENRLEFCPEPGDRGNFALALKTCTDSGFVEIPIGEEEVKRLVNPANLIRSWFKS